MADSRLKQLAEILVDHSTRVQPEEIVTIASTELAQPLVEMIYALVLERGAFPRLKLTFSTLQPLFYRLAADWHLDNLPEIEALDYKKADVLINIRAPGNLRELSAVDPSRITRRARTMQPLQAYLMSGRLRWVVCNYPTQALAQEAEMSLFEYQDFVFGATNIDWGEQLRFQEQIKTVFDAGSEIRLVGPETDLRLSIAGRKGTPCAGEHNMPDGEIFYAPREESAEGYITYDYPAIYAGQEVIGVRLEFARGKVVRAAAVKNQPLLEQVLATDAGAGRIGEFGLGTNYGIRRFTKNILFDEKIGGSIHLALGRAYEESGGQNRSAVHWDMIKDLRRGGRILLDGRVVQENGSFNLS